MAYTVPLSACEDTQLSPQLACSPEFYVNASAALIAENRLDEAYRLLVEAKGFYPESSSIGFAFGMLASAAGEFDTAIEEFESILLREPQASRVRLELGRVLLQAGRSQEAARQLRVVNRDELPDAVRRNMMPLMLAAQADQRFYGSLSFAIAPDTNINAATQTQTIDVFGLPFTLSEDARASSGIGLLISTRGEWIPAKFNRTELRVGGNISRNDYRGSSFDDTLTSLYAGPTLRTERFTMSTVVTGHQRWYGESKYNNSAGMAVNIQAPIAGSSNIVWSAAVHQIDYEQLPERDSTLIRTNLLWQKMSGAHAGIQLSTGWMRESARSPNYSSDTVRLGASYFTNLTGGIRMSLSPEVSITQYDAPDPLFATRRRDQVAQLSIGVSKPSWSYRGFYPELTVLGVKRYSNIAFFEFDRVQLKLDLRRVF